MHLLQIGRVMAWEAYPRRFWIWWCGGMSVRDLIVVAIIIAYNLYYFLDYFLPYQRRLNAGMCVSTVRSLV
jgi:hypothetical protein